MKINNQSFPHPVLGIQDDVGGSLLVQLNWSCDRANYFLYPVFNLQNPDLEILISKKMAAYTAHIECANTFFRNSFTFFNQAPTIKINADSLRDKVEVSFYITSLEKIDNYRNNQAHLDYQSEEFQIERGDVLAFGGETSFLAVKNYETLKAVSSIMVIKKDNDDKSLVRVNYNSDKIELWLNQNNFKTYNDFKHEKQYTAIFHSSLVFPVLLKALEYIKNEESDFSDFKWFLTIKTRIDDENLSLEDEDKHFEVLQKLFGNPFERFFNSVEAINEAMFNNE